eukprot:TRINITY_DN1553_c0_g1_i1.p1 TRINITY_DN1553_c0_g1~~TRINITY_DN1553_c0_g1_i1.p1  ORF type:complete len:322 (-),score=75.22 TRINITY_DN1553_c0_g1_i1:51-1016(-)
MKFKSLVAAMGVAVTTLVSAQALALDKTIPEYEKTSGISGNFSSVGSDTLANMMTFWAEEYKRFYPNVNIQIQAAGSSTAPPALTEGTANFGPMSRKMKSKEIEAFEKRYGYKPTEVRVAIDALAVLFIKTIQLKVCVSTKLMLSSHQRVNVVHQTKYLVGVDVGLTGDWAAKDIQLYGRNSVSGTYGYFKKMALCKGDFRNNVNEQPGSASVVQSISSSVNAIGYSGIGYKTSGVRTVPLAKKGDKFVDATLDNVATGKYPLSRFLYVYINKHPNKPLSPIDAEFLKMVLSQSGQKIVEKDGYVPLSGAMAMKDLRIRPL